MHITISFLYGECLVKPGEASQVGHTVVLPTKTCKMQECQDVTQTTLTALLPKLREEKLVEKTLVFVLPCLTSPFFHFPPSAIESHKISTVPTSFCKVIFSYLPYLVSPLLSSSLSFYMSFT